MVSSTSVAVVVMLLCASSSLSSAIPKPENDHKTSDDRVQDRNLSDQDHFENEEHNPDYDHDAFLGDEAKSFDQLTPEESKYKLGIIYDKIDRDHNGLISERELAAWIKHVQNRYIEMDTDRQWGEYSKGNDGEVAWEEFKKATYGDTAEGDGAEENEVEKGSYDYKEMMKRDKRRWHQADSNKDGKLTKEEFSYFLHPEEADHMRDIVIMETIEDIDKNKDGVLDVEEYISDMWPDKGEEEEPEWVKTEREQFTTFRDKNKDGVLDKNEVRDWIIPSDYDHSEAESKHLIYESDADRDGELSKEEVLDKYDLFVGSQATDYGEALIRHEEF